MFSGDKAEDPGMVADLFRAQRAHGGWHTAPADRRDGSGSALRARLRVEPAFGGLVFGTLAMKLIALAPLNRLHSQEAPHGAQ